MEPIEDLSTQAGSDAFDAMVEGVLGLLAYEGTTVDDLVHHTDKVLYVSHIAGVTDASTNFNEHRLTAASLVLAVFALKMAKTNHQYSGRLLKCAGDVASLVLNRETE